MSFLRDVAWAVCSMLMIKLDVKTKVIAEKATIIAIVLEMLGTNFYLEFVGDYKRFLQVRSIAANYRNITYFITFHHFASYKAKYSRV